jgi:ParB family chromosome partitioning protein
MAKKASTAAAAATEEFRNIPLGLIIVESQVRSSIDTEGESFKRLMASIAEKGVIQPIVVTPRGEQFLLLAGERRFLACQMLGLETIPARILPDIQSAEEILTIQLIENLQREDIDPIDKANGIVSYIRFRHPDMDLDGIVSGLITLRRDETRVENGFALTVSAIVKVIGISIPSIQNILSLLRLEKDIQDTIRTGAIPVSQGYIFADNLDNPGLRQVLEAVVANPVTNKELIRMLKKAGATGMENAGRPAIPFKAVYTSLRTATKELEGGKILYEAAALDELLVQLNALIALVEKAKEGGGTAAAPAPAKTTTKKTKKPVPT